MPEIIKTINGSIITTIGGDGIQTLDGQVITLFRKKDVAAAVAAVGYTHTVIGVAAANISKINGIATANISKVNGV